MDLDDLSRTELRPATSQDLELGFSATMFRATLGSVSQPAVEYEFDIAVSFAGEDREHVHEFVELLKQAGIRTFYDDDHAVEMWGQDLVEYFDQIFREKARYAVLFVSRSYREKMWTTHERRSALARGLDQPTPYVLPIRLDDTELPGMRPTVGYLDARKLGLDGIVAATIAKVSAGESIAAPTISRVPRTEVERQQLLLQRPPAWEYLFFGARLLAERDAVEPAYRDHQLRFATRIGDPVDETSMRRALDTAVDDAMHLSRSLMEVMSTESQDWAFGAPGKSGDPEHIVHLAGRWNAVYLGLLEWASGLRSMRAPDRWRHAVSLLAQYVDEPVNDYRAFVENLVGELDHFASARTHDGPVAITLVLKMRIPDAVAEAYKAERARLKG